jgi:hypothetical protein
MGGQPGTQTDKFSLIQTVPEDDAMRIPNGHRLNRKGVRPGNCECCTGGEHLGLAAYRRHTELDPSHIHRHIQYSFFVLAEDHHLHPIPAHLHRKREPQFDLAGEEEMATENPKPIPAPFELGSVRIEHPKTKRNSFPRLSGIGSVGFPGPS